MGSDIYDATVGEFTGSNRTAKAAGRAAQAQEAALRTGVGYAQEGLTAAQDAGKAAVAAAQSPQELAALRQALDTQTRAIGRQEQLFASIDPAIMEASQQALKLLRGEEAKSLSPLKQNRDLQRKKLVDRLREQLGPGAETSTAGIQALNQFDQETSTLLSGAQESSIANLFGMGLQGSQAKLGAEGLINQGIGQIGNIGQAFGGAAQRLTQANLGSGGLVQGGFANLINAQSGLAAGSGSQYVTEQLKGQAQNQFINDRIQSFEQMNAQVAGSAAGSAGSICCFIFMEARYGDGTMDKVVRQFRDNNLTIRNKRGYYKLSEVLVPLMRKYPLVKWLVRLLMTDPLVAYGKYYYGENKWGRVFAPVKNFWLATFDYLGSEHEFIRENGEVV